MRNDQSEGDRLVEVTVEGATAIMHRSYVDDGLQQMERIAEVPIDGGEAIVFEPGGLHVMMAGIEGVQLGDSVTFQLTFALAGLIQGEATVMPYSELSP